MNHEIGQRIKAHRNRMGLTQSQLGQAMGVQKSAIQKYECGNVTSIKVDMLHKFADVFGVSISSMLGEQMTLREFNDKLYEDFGVVGVELMSRFAELDDKGRMKVLIYTQDIQLTYSRKGDD